MRLIEIGANCVAVVLSDEPGKFAICFSYGVLVAAMIDRVLHVAPATTLTSTKHIGAFRRAVLATAQTQYVSPRYLADLTAVPGCGDAGQAVQDA